MRTNTSGPTGQSRHRAAARGGVGLRKLIAVLLLAPTVLVQAGALTPAGAVVTAGFEIDGDTPVNEGGIDWDSPTVADPTTDPTGQADGSNFTQGSKEFQNPSAWEEGTGTSTNQGDISDVYSHFSTIGEDSWAFLGFRRIAESGTMTFMVEFNQRANLPLESGDSVQFRPDRRVNDLLLRFEQDGNGNFALTAAYKWTESPSGTFAAGCFTVPGYSVPSAYCPTPTNTAGFTGATGEGKLFAEGAVNLSAFDTVGDCRGAYGVMNVRSFAGNNETSSLLDFVGGVGIEVDPTCGKLVIEKKDQFGASVPGATFTITRNPTPGVTGPAEAQLVVQDGPGGSDSDTVADGIITIDPAKPGTYTVVETAAPPGDYVFEADPAKRTWTVTVTKTSTTWTPGPAAPGTTPGSGPVVVVNQLKFKPLVVSKTANPTFARDYDWTIEKSVKGEKSTTVGEGTPASFDYEVVVTPSGGTDTAFMVGGKITVSNPNPKAISGVTLTDALPNASCTIAKPAGALTIPSGDSTFDYSCELSNATKTTTGTNTATATWDASTYVGSNGSASGQAAFDFAKATVSETDETATVTDTQIDLNGDAPGDVVLKASDGVQTLTYTKKFDGVPGACKTYDNTAKVFENDTQASDTDTETVTVCVGLKDLVVTKTADPAFARDYDWTIEKSVDGEKSATVGEGSPASFDYEVVVTPSGGTDTAFVVGGLIRVANPNATAISGVTLADNLPGATCTIVEPASSVTIPKGTSTFNYTCELPNATKTTTGTNTATATWDAAKYYGTSGSATGQASFDFATAKLSETDETATVTDSQVDLNGDAPGDVVLKAIDGPKTLTYTKELDGVPGACKTYDNTAKVVEDDTQDSDADTETVTVCVALKDLVVTKTAEPTFARDYDWTIEKSVRGAKSQTVPQGTPGSFTYDVVVTPSAPQDGVFMVRGEITVKNLNATTISGVTLTDSLPGATCTINLPEGALSIPTGTKTFAYSCVLPNATAATTGTNTATATWNASAYHGTDGTASGTAQFDFADADRDVTDETATVTDTQVDLNDEVPGGVVVSATEGPRTFTYTKEFDGVPGECTTHDNTAKVVADDSLDIDADSETVTVCVEKPLVADVSGSADMVRDYAWSIVKKADATQRTVDGSGKATFTYTVTAIAGAATDSGWQAKGSVVITNPNTYAAGDITADVTAATTLGGGSVCTVAGGNDVVVPAIGDGSEKVVLPIACTFTSKPASSGALSVTAAWDPAGEGSAASVTDSTPIAFAVRSETNKTVQVVDDKTVAGQRVVLDPSLAWQSGLVRSYTYSMAHAGGVAGACQSYTNTATIDLAVGTDPTASAVVLACTPVPPVVVPPVAPEVLPEQAFGKAVGAVRASCQGTVKATLRNRSGEKVTYTLRVGTKVHRIKVASLAKKTFVTQGKARAKVTLKIGTTRLDKLRVPALCQAPEVLPDTGLRSTSS